MGHPLSLINFPVKEFERTYGAAESRALSNHTCDFFFATV
jgi:hypothetical protein